MMYKQAGDLNKAIESFMETDNYHLLLVSSYEANMETDKLSSLINTYLTKLEQKKSWKEIGEVHLTHTKDNEKSIEYLMKDGQFFKSIEIAGSQENLLSQI